MLAVLAAAVAGVAAAIGLWPRPAPPTLPVTRFAFPVFEGHLLTLSRRAVAISPDGTRIAYSADGKLYLRALAEGESRPIAGADPAIQPAFSPDGDSIVFWQDPTLQRIPVAGGVPTTICVTTPAPFGLHWSESGIVFVEPGKGIMRVSPDGGTPEMLVSVPPADGLANGPQLLPDGKTILFTLAPAATPASAAWDRAQVVAQSLETGQRSSSRRAATAYTFRQDTSCTWSRER